MSNVAAKCSLMVYLVWRCCICGSTDANTMAAAGTLQLLGNEFGTKSQTAAMRQSIEKIGLASLAKSARLTCTAAGAKSCCRTTQLTEHKDLVFASGAAAMILSHSVGCCLRPGLVGIA